MEWTSLNDLREMYLSFYETKGHLRHKSYPLVPINDKSILLINAGMTPLKKYFTGEEEPPRHRMVTCQKCIRTPDIERVGITARHGTYFEMLGNFSFGDYFKHEAISWAWEFITQWLKLPVEKLWVTIYQDDDEAYDIWANEIGVKPERIVRLGKEDNFWEHGSGPCGPCSEIHFDRGEEYGCGRPDCKPGCDCDRFMEFWNLVFTQFNNDGHNNYTRLAKPNIDTGMGLERLACLMQGVNNLFEVDTVKNIMAAICKVANVEYGHDKQSDISLRVITDHIRSTTFMICDGVVPSNEGRGYVLRRLLRRAARHGRLLGINHTFISDIVDVVAKENYTEYPELTEKLAYIKKIVSTEEERFAATIDSGLSILQNMIDEIKENGNTVIPGADVFKLYDTFGFPIDLTREIATEAGLTLDEDGFKALMDDQRARARSARANISGWSDASKSLLKEIDKTVFEGYTSTTVDDAIVKSIIVDDESVDEISEGEFTLVLDKTPFYGEGGGQVGDTGKITSDHCSIIVTDTKKSDGVYIHLCTLESGSIKVGEKVVASIDVDRRNAIKRNHSVAHMLQAALREVLGNHVEQAGSYVDENRVRFDFSHFAAMTEEEIQKVESIVNSHILAGDTIVTKEMDIEEAKATGAMALFGEKYGKVVRVVKMGEFSTELCGGTHLDNTAKAGLFKIISESSVAAGVRRVEGTTGLGVLELFAEKENLILDTAKELKSNNVQDIAKKALALNNELKAQKKTIDELNSQIANSKVDSMKSSAVTVGNVTVISGKIEGTVDGARTLGDTLRNENASNVIVLAVVDNDSFKFAVFCGKDAINAGAHAGNIAKQVAAITGGNGGGKPDSAMAGGKDISKLQEALNATPEIIKNMLK